MNLFRMDCLKEASKGKMEDVFPWLEKIESEWKPEHSTVSSILASLRGGAAAIDAIVKTFPFAKWTRKIDKTEWSINEILCHLRDLDQEINLVRMQTILEEHKPFIAGIESDQLGSRTRIQLPEWSRGIEGIHFRQAGYC